MKTTEATSIFASMNRELKFRVYIPDHEKFCYFSLGDFDYSDRYLRQYQYPVQQYTGLKDRNGKEIYEGDILEELIVNETQKALGVCKQVLGGWKIFSLNNTCWHGWKQIVVGNIFENPELLK